MLQSFRLLNLVWFLPGALPQVLKWQAFSRVFTQLVPSKIDRITYQNDAGMINEIHLENLNQPERLIERNPGHRPGHKIKASSSGCKPETNDFEFKN